MQHQPSNSNAEPRANEQIRLIERALRTAAQSSAPLASSGAGYNHANSPRTPSVGTQRVSKSRMISITSFALALPSLVGVAAWLTLTQQPQANMTENGRSIPAPVLTAPVLLEATAGQRIFLPIALDGTDGVPAGSAIAVTGLPHGTMLSKG